MASAHYASLVEALESRLPARLKSHAGTVVLVAGGGVGLLALRAVTRHFYKSNPFKFGRTGALKKDEIDSSFTEYEVCPRRERPPERWRLPGLPVPRPRASVPHAPPAPQTFFDQKEGAGIKDGQLAGKAKARLGTCGAPRPPAADAPPPRGAGQHARVCGQVLQARRPAAPSRPPPGGPGKGEGLWCPSPSTLERSARAAVRPRRARRRAGAGAARPARQLRAARQPGAGMSVVRASPFSLSHTLSSLLSHSPPQPHHRLLRVRLGPVVPLRAPQQGRVV